MRTEPTDLFSGRRVGKYEIIRRLAVGGMGELFLARERGLAGFDRLVVLKQLISEFAQSQSHADRLADEARIAAHLRHPNIVQIHELGEFAGNFFLVMEYVPGADLARLNWSLKVNQQNLSLPLAVHVVAELASALEFAHSACDTDGKPLGLVHRDVNPQNILISRRGDVKLADFGIAKAANRLHRTQTGLLLGKLGYMAPEQLDGAAFASTDVFAAGIVLWECTLGQRLFNASNELEMIRLLHDRKIPSPRSQSPSYPRALEAVVMATLECEPERRISASELRRSLREVARQLGDPVDADRLGALVKRLFPEQPLAISASDASDARRDTAPLASSSTPPEAISRGTAKRVGLVFALVAATLILVLKFTIQSHRSSAEVKLNREIAAQVAPLPHPLPQAVPEQLSLAPVAEPSQPSSASAHKDRTAPTRPLSNRSRSIKHPVTALTTPHVKDTSKSKPAEDELDPFEN